jgi:uncharacterized membrane protein
MNVSDRMNLHNRMNSENGMCLVHRRDRNSHNHWRHSLVMCFLLSACAGEDALRTPSTQPDQAGPAPSATLVYACNDYEFVARVGTGTMTLWLEDGDIVLPQVRSASGTLYEEGDITFWSKGNEAMLTVAGQSYQNCHLAPERVPWEDARRRGVDFRAIGNEPPWYVEIQSGRQMLFVVDYGMRRILVPDTGARNVGATRVFQGASGGHNLRLEIVDEPCADSMSGETFPARVTATLDGTTYQGCGQDLDHPWQDPE